MSWQWTASSWCWPTRRSRWGWPTACCCRCFWLRAAACRLPPAPHCKLRVLPAAVPLLYRPACSGTVPEPTQTLSARPPSSASAAQVLLALKRSDLIKKIREENVHVNMQDAGTCGGRRRRRRACSLLLRGRPGNR